MYNALLDSERWNRLKLRADDIIVASWPKSGTTWMQQIVAQLVFCGDPSVFGHSVSPWVESRFSRDVHIAERQQHRRILKTHLPAEYIPQSSNVSYIYVARDPRDVFWSWHRHQSRLSDDTYELMNKTPGRHAGRAERLDADVAKAFDLWLDRDDALPGPYWANIRSWWDIRDRPKVMLVHYSEMTLDLESFIYRLGKLLQIDVKPAMLEMVIRHCSINHMKALAGKDIKLSWAFGGGGGDNLVHKGKGGDWRCSLPKSTITKLGEVARSRLSPECVGWLFTPMPHAEIPRSSPLPSTAQAMSDCHSANAAEWRVL